jgi:hypothetical protein
MDSGFNWRGIWQGLGLGRREPGLLQSPVVSHVQAVAATTLIATVSADGGVVVQYATPDTASALPSVMLSPCRLAQTLTTQHLARHPGGILGDDPLLNHQEASLRSVVGLMGGSELHPHRGASGEHPAWSSRRLA